MYKDSQDDYWKSEEIGIVFTTEANQTNHDLYHDKKKVEGIETIANYRNKSVEVIGGREVPINSWRKDIMVTDSEFIELIKSNEINGVSINNGLKVCPVCVDELKNIKGNIFYNRDIENKECMEPLFTSLVPDPANGYGMNIYSYDKFLAKSNDPEGLLSKINVSSKEDEKLSNKFKEMLKGFGESIIGYSNEIDEFEESTETKETETTAPTESETNDLEAEITELKKSVEKQEAEIAELKKSTTIVKEKDSIDDRREEIRKAIIDKEYSDIEYPDVWIVIMTEEAVVIEDYEQNKYFKVDYTVNENDVSIGDFVEVEMQYAPIGEETEEEPEEEVAEETTETSPESQKSRKPKIKVDNEKLETIEMEKSKEKVNHLGMPIKSTKELSKPRNTFNF
ncbi:MAG: XkdF-like putative serine protease domain-containing protein [Methanobrevibacter sp.]|jgi:hypothetical protein|nr:XkdF-like putative serine protease domain-containing protein [Methanobrevibacter sp.]